MKIQNIQHEAEQKRVASCLDPVQLPPAIQLSNIQLPALGQPAAPTPAKDKQD